jgi:shikimate dehydrogenase
MIERPGRLVLLGHPIRHSLSPLFQNAALRSAGIPIEYQPLDVAPAELEVMLRRLTQDRAAGNVTIPHKIAVHDACATLTPLARRVGAVNTFWTEDSALVGDNTDVEGFNALVREVLGEIPRSARVALLGAGGASAAVLAAIEQWDGARALLAGRSPEKGVALAARFPGLAEVADSTSDALRGATIVVNATPVGMTDDRHPVSLDLVPEGATVLDLVYRKGGTSWTRLARERGQRAADGLTMLIAQGAASFERWFGIAPDLDAMRKAVA